MNLANVLTTVTHSLVLFGATTIKENLSFSQVASNKRLEMAATFVISKAAVILKAKKKVPESFVIGRTIEWRCNGIPIAPQA